MPLDLPEGFEEAEKLTSRFENTAALAKAYRELERKLGSALPAPTSEDSVNELFKRLGAPDSPAGYEIPAGVDPAALGNLREYAAKAKVTPEQFKRLAEGMHEAAAAKYAADSEAKVNASSRVIAEYGEGFAAAQANVIKALQLMGPVNAQKYDTQDPEIFRILEKLGAGQPTPGAHIAPLTGSQSAPSFDPQAVASEARRLIESAAYSDRRHEEHNTAKEEYAKRVHQLIAAQYNGAYDKRLMPKQAGIWGR